MARTRIPLFFALYLLASGVGLGMTSAVEIPFKRAPRGASMRSPRVSTRYVFGQSMNNRTLENVNDVRYVTNITVNGVAVQVALDTGSTDLWVNPPGGIGPFNDTRIPLQLDYGDGTYGVQGTIGVSAFTFGSYYIERQAFLHVESSTVQGLAEDSIYGLMGLSFDFSTASPINLAIKRIYSADAHWGRSVLRNIFSQNPKQPNFIGINLARTGDLEDTTGGSFTIGEYDSRFEGVASTKKLPQHPKGGDRWTTLLEGISVDGKNIKITSTVPGVPAGQAQALLDTGDPNSVFPIELLDGMYSNIPGAALYDDPFMQTRVWIVPCNTTAHVEFVFGGQKYLIHPLDLSIISDPVRINGKQYTACISSFVGADNWAEGAFDISLGDAFLRNVYSVFDFGDTLPDGSAGEPYIQLVNKTDPATANSQVASIRGQTVASLPPEMSPADLVAILLGPKGTSLNSTDEDISLGAGRNSGFGTLSDAATLHRYAPIIIFLLVLNLALTLSLIACAAMMWVRRGYPSSRNRRSMPREIDLQYMPVKNSAEHHHHESHSSVYMRPYDQLQVDY